MQCTRTITLSCLRFELFPFIKVSCSENKSKSIEVTLLTLLKVHKMINGFERKCSVQEPLLYVAFF